MMMEEEECVGGEGEATVLQVHLPCDPPVSCTAAAVGTDLSMSDISRLHAEVCELRRTQVCGSPPALCSVCKADLNPSRGSDHMLQDDAVDGVCAAAEWPDDAPQESELKCEEDEPSTSVGSHGSQNPGETCSSPHTPLKTFSAEEQHAEHTPLMMCSVTLVDCRTMVELNGNITQEEELDDGSVHAEEPEEPEEPEEGSDEFCPSTPLGGHSESCDEESRSSVKPDQRKKKKKSGVKTISPCSICGQELMSAAFLTRHMKMHENRMKQKTLRPHVCTVCEKGYPTLSALNVHMKSHSVDKPFRCDLCGNCFKTKGNLKCHQSIHTGQRPFQCAYCQMSFYHKTHLKKHERVHTNEKPYVCSVCEKGFITVSALKQHQRVHTGEKPYSCSYCDMTFGQKVNRDRHERTHTGEKPFLCDHCGKGFSDPRHFYTHKRIHVGEKRERPFQCSFCGNSFFYRINLKQHERVHTKERPYSCTQCSKTFARPDVLKTHLRVHTGEKPYHCSICDQGFTYLGSFRAHQKNHTKEDVKQNP
ncbi:zinc finger protein 250-like isoform X3 [Hemibagrus wyckioides]|uniref:zinc finger protein 250-like isoform X3 n=1 Tax=Hemibagrus wyckioides TaxID=337641 RepID=UPI00266BD2E4|nr:zinc finger protein 250-like isoform X3 [Hemibagrus wyckioides]